MKLFPKSEKGEGLVAYLAVLAGAAVVVVLIVFAALVLFWAALASGFAADNFPQWLLDAVKWLENFGLPYPV